MSLNGNLNKSQFMEELQQKVEHINNVLEKFLPAEEGQQRIIFEAMNYSVRAGGKRLRPILMEETYHMFGGSSAVIEPFMAAIEMIHTYSLVHDDLPAMDNDEYRRGKKTTHVVYGEAMAILAGDALLTYAFETAAKALDIEPQNPGIGKAIRILSAKAGIYGMVGGQTVDVESENTCDMTKEKLDFIYRLKTSALIEASMMIGSVLAGATGSEQKIVEAVASKVGLAFQIQDDILDVTSTMEVLGKPIGSDEKNHKSTYVTYEGIEKAKQDVADLSEKAIAQMETLVVKNEFLTELLRYLISREK
jgi:geranylgeranyl diphosphate synthase type II